MELLLHVGLSNAALAAVLAVPAALAGLLRLRPALVHSLWLLVLLKLVTPPLLSWPVYQLPAEPAPPPPPGPAAEAPPVFTLVVEPEPPAETPPLAEPEPAGASAPPAPGGEGAAGVKPPEPRPAPATAPPAAPAPPFPWQPWAVAAWLAGSLGWFALALVRVRRFQRLLRLASPAPEALRAEVAALAQRLGLARVPAVGLVPGAVSPMLWAAGGAPRLLVPRDLLGRLSEAERATLLAHELAHLRRRDHWVRGLEFLATGLYWWHPVAWWARRGLREAEEQCCDAWVVWALPAAARAYATALVETIDFLSDARPVLPPAASGVGHVRLLKRRLTMILQGRTPRALSPAGLLTVLGLGAFLLPLLPTWSQAEPPRSDNQKAIQKIEDVIRTLKGDDKETREQLERALKALQEKEKASKAARDAEVEQARAEADAAAAELKGLTAKLQAAQERHQKAQQRLAELTGTMPVTGTEYYRLIVRDRLVKEGELQAAQVKAKEAAVLEAAAQHEQAKKDLERMKALHAKGAVTAEEVEKAATQVKVTAAQLAGKQAELEEAKARRDPALPAAAEQALRLLGNEKARVLIKPATPAPVADQRLKELEKRLNDLLREVEGLRKEMSRPGAPAAPAPR